MSYAERIPLKDRREIGLMRDVGRYTAEILLELRELAKPGVATRVFDEHARKALAKRGLTSPFIGYAPGGLPPYPAAVCISVNEEIVHGIPGAKELKEGDIVGIDFGAVHKGYHGDTAVTVVVGRASQAAEQLVSTTRAALDEGIAAMLPGKRLSDVGAAVQRKAEAAGFSVVRQFVGHGIGRQMHEPPQIPNYGPAGRGPRLQPGMVFAIEPMVNAGGEEVRMLEDEWTAVTADGSLSAHFEHTVLITDNGPEVLTLVPGSH